MALFVATSCELHPDEIFTGFCPSCLRERLAGLDAASSLSAAPRRSTSALKSIFSLLPSSSSGAAVAGHDASSSAAAPAPAQPAGGSSSAAELRRCKSFSVRSSERRERDLNGEMRPMKIHIDLESQSNTHNHRANQNPNLSAHSSSNGGSFWMKKWNSWRNKHKQKKQQDQNLNLSKASKAAMPRQTLNPRHVSSRPRQHCDTQSELGAARRSFDCASRFSFDELPRHSLDGTGRPVYSRLHPTLSTVQDRSDGLILENQENQEDQERYSFPGSQAQTRDYYLDSSSRRRRSFERSISGRKLPQNQIDLEIEHNKSVVNMNSKVSPAGSTEFHHLQHLAMRDELSESFDSAHRDPYGISGEKEKKKKWSFWGFIHKKKNEKDRNENVVDRSFSEAWPELNINNLQFGRSNSVVSARNSFSGRRKSVDGNLGFANRSARFENNGNIGYNSINGNINGNNNYVDNNGMLRFYLNPIGGSQSGRKSGGIRPVNYSSNSNAHNYSSKRIY